VKDRGRLLEVLSKQTEGDLFIVLNVWQF